MGLKVEGANDALDGLFGSTIYIALHTGDPSGSNELTSGNSPGYARQAVTSSGWSKSTSGSTRRVRNSAAIQFSSGTSNAWQDATHWAAYDAATAGNRLASGAFSNNPPAPVSGDSVQIAVNGISFGFTID